jgi:hypothetical protein
MLIPPAQSSWPGPSSWVRQRRRGTVLAGMREADGGNIVNAVAPV